MLGLSVSMVVREIDNRDIELKEAVDLVLRRNHEGRAAEVRFNLVLVELVDPACRDRGQEATQSRAAFPPTLLGHESLLARIEPLRAASGEKLSQRLQGP